MNKLTHTVDEVAKLVGVTRPTIQAELNKGRLRSIKIGRRRMITKVQFDDWVKLMEEENQAEHKAK